ncbi:hypothetical protein [Paenibacillus taichungensis]
MKVPKRYLKKDPDIFKVIGLSFKPQKSSTDTEQTTSIGFKIGDWEEPINFVPYLQTTENTTPQIH